MNRQMRRASLANGRRLQALPWNSFEECTEEAISRHRLLNPESNYRPDVVYKNNKYIVQVFRNRTLPINGLKADKCLIRRCDSEKVFDWMEIQRVKNEIFGEHETAIQIFPPEIDLVNEANVYWLWVLK